MIAYVLDTNVIAEIAKARPDEKVVAWIEATEQRRLHVTSTVLGEVSRMRSCVGSIDAFCLSMAPRRSSEAG